MNWYRQIQLKYAFPSRSPDWDKLDEVKRNRDDIQQMLDEGYKYREIQDLFDIKSDQIFRRMLAEVDVGIDADRLEKWRVSKLRELAGRNATLTQMANEVRLNPNTVKRLLEDNSISYKINTPHQFSDEEGKSIISLHVDKGMGPTEIAKLTGFNVNSVISYLQAKGVYRNLRKNTRGVFSPTPEQIEKIDYWYAMPPRGEGRSIIWIADQLGFSRGQLKYWFVKTGRPIRSYDEQIAIPETRERLSDSLRSYWDRVGKLEGYLLSLPSRQQAINYLNGFVSILIDRNPENSHAVFNKYKAIIDNHVYPDETPAQQAS